MSFFSRLTKLIDSGFPPEVAEKIASGELPMDRASRMERAREQGFDPDSPTYHGTQSDIQEFIPSERGKMGPGVYTSPSPIVAGNYATPGHRVPRSGVYEDRDILDEELLVGQGANVMPLLLRGDRMERFEALRQNPDIPIALLSEPTTEGAGTLAGRLKQEGVTGLEIQGLGSDGMRTYNVREQNTFDPSDIRSVNAAFDPDYKGPNILGSAVPVALGTGIALLGSGEAEAAEALEPVEPGYLDRASDILGGALTPDISPEGVVGRLETAAMLASSVPAFVAGIGGLLKDLAIEQDPEKALNTYRDIQQKLTYLPKTEGGIERATQIGELLEPLGQAYETYGQGVGSLTGSPLTGQYAEEFLDPLMALPFLAASAKAARKGSSVDLRAPPDVKAEAPERVLQLTQQRAEAENKPARITMEDVTSFLEEEQSRRYGGPLDIYDDTNLEKMVDAAEDEARYQLTQAETGIGWYDSDVKKTFENAQKIPGLESLGNNETHRVIWSAFAAPTSIGQKVDGNTRAATAAFLQYLRTGEVPVNPPKPKTVTEGIPNAGWGAKQQAVGSGMRVISHLIKKFGEEGFADWWLSPHTLKELTDLRKEAGLGGAPSGLSGGAKSMHMGAKILGDKTGQFSLNINGYQGTTKDLWFARMFNRHAGTLRDNQGMPIGGPRNTKERRRMEEFGRRLAERMQDEGLNEQDIQAALWFYEQGLTSDLGVPSRPGSFSTGMEKVSEQLRPAVRASDETQVGPQQSGEISGYRSISPTQRAIRAERRGGLPRQSDGSDLGQAPGPYERRVGSADGRDGLLELEPDQLSTARYQEAGLNVPKLFEVDAQSNAESYNLDMQSALADNPTAPQVEIKSPEDLAGMNLLRTEAGSGVAIKPDGDIVAVFASPNEPRKGSYAMLQAAVQAGGTKLDAFDTYLPGIYESVGFRPVAKIPWNDDFAPPGWNKEVFAKYKGGEPDNVYFVYDPDYFGSDGADNLDYSASPKDAEAIQNQAVKDVESRVKETRGFNRGGPVGLDALPRPTFYETTPVNSGIGVLPKNMRQRTLGISGGLGSL